MCEPILMATLAVATTAGSIYQQVKSADFQEEMLREQLAAAEVEINDSTDAEINERMREMRREQGRIKVASGEAGLQLGGSVAALLGDSLMQATLSNERSVSNRDRQLENTRREANNALSRIEKPTALGAGLQLVSAGLNAYSGASSAQIQRNQSAGQIGRTKAGS